MWSVVSRTTWHPLHERAKQGGQRGLWYVGAQVRPLQAHVLRMCWGPRQCHALRSIFFFSFFFASCALLSSADVVYMCIIATAMSMHAMITAMALVNYDAMFVLALIGGCRGLLVPPPMVAVWALQSHLVLPEA